jgi:hypothetical protein
MSTIPAEMEVSIDLFNLQGEKAKTLTYNTSALSEMSWDVSDIPRGFYLAMVHYGDSTEYFKIIRE